MLTHGSLFAGIGGFDLGFDRAGIETLWTVENDKNCNYILEAHWPDVKRYGNVKEVGKRNLAPVDIISGGFPCQDLSVAGRRAGLAGKRSGHWFEFARIIEEMEAEWVVVENVPGLFSSNGGADFAVIIRTLELFGYCVAWRVLDSQYFGVPQRRRRVFIVGSLRGTGSVKVLFESEGGKGHSAESKEEREAIANGTISRALTACKTATGRLDPNEQTFVTNAFNGYTGGPDDNDAQAHHLVVFDLAQITSNVKRTRVDEGLPASTLNQTGQMHLAYNWQSGGDCRLSFGLPNLQANQVPAVGVRRLTPTECERLQGFPDGWTEGLSDSARYRCLGNAVTVNVAEWISRRIVVT